MDEQQPEKKKPGRKKMNRVRIKNVTLYGTNEEKQKIDDFFVEGNGRIIGDFVTKFTLEGIDRASIEAKQ